MVPGAKTISESLKLEKKVSCELQYKDKHFLKEEGSTSWDWSFVCFASAAGATTPVFRGGLPRVARRSSRKWRGGPEKAICSSRREGAGRTDEGGRDVHVDTFCDIDLI